MLDTQFVTDHLRGFGAIEIPRRRYRALLDVALEGDADFGTLPLTGRCQAPKRSGSSPAAGDIFGTCHRPHWNAFGAPSAW